MFAGPIAGRLTDKRRAAPADDERPAAVAGSLFWLGHLAVDTPYASLAGAFVLMGFGMGLVMSPMSTAAMNSVEQTQGRRRLRDPVDEPDGRRHRSASPQWAR